MKVIRIDKELLEKNIQDLDEVLAKFPDHSGKIMTTAVYTARNTYKSILRSAVLSEKRNNENENQLNLEL